MKGFVFGKFLPFHKGHEAMVKFAAALCDHLTVVVCCSDKEDIPPEIRLQWVAETFRSRPGIHSLLLCYDESELPNSSVSSREISQVWALKFAEILPEVGLLVSSEPYGEFVAEFMGISHVPFDPARGQVPVSATLIRSNPWANWQFLPDAVKPYYMRRVTILGTESAGKTVMAERLAAHFNMPMVAEAGREIIPTSRHFTWQDLHDVAREHVRRVLDASQHRPPLLILDTDLYVTQSYARFAFGKYMDLPDTWYVSQRADLYLYLTKDVPYFQDGTRMNEEQRNRLDQSHLQTLDDFGVRVEFISGDWDGRWESVLRLMRALQPG